MRSFLPLLCIGLDLVLAGGCQTPLPPVDIRPAALEGVPSDGVREAGADNADIQLSGAINETLSVTFTIRPEEAVPQPNLHVLPLRQPRGTINASAVQLFRLHSVRVDRLPGWHIRSIAPAERNAAPLDVLVPIHAPTGGLPNPLRPGEAYHIWADVDIPKGTAAGVYTGGIELRSGPQTVGRMGITLTVWPILLPDRADAAMIAEVDHRALFAHHVPGLHGGTTDWRRLPQGAHASGLLRSTVQRLRRHRLTPVLPMLAPDIDVGADQRVQIDWSLYDSIVAPLMSGEAFHDRVPPEYWPIPAAALAGSRREPDRPMTPGLARLFMKYLSRCADHFEQMGWLSRAYLMPAGSADTAASVYDVAARVDAIAKRAKEADTRISVIAPLWPQDMAPYGWVGYDLRTPRLPIDGWAPPAQFYDPAVMAAERQDGRRTWVRVDRPPYSGSIEIAAPPAYTRVLGWQASRLGAGAVLLGTVNPWPAADERPSPQDCLRVNPATLLYPGGPFGLDEPVASVRLKHLRRGMQDAAYLMLLREHGLGHIADAVGEALARRAGTAAYRTHFADGRPAGGGGWADDEAAYHLAREVMAMAMVEGSEAGGRSDPADPQGMLRQTTTWRRLMLLTHELRLVHEGTRIRRTPGEGPPGLSVEAHLKVENDRRVPVSGELAIGDLPQGWSAEATLRVQPAILPGAGRRIIIHLDGGPLPAALDGIVTMTAALTDEDGQTVSRRFRTALITAIPTDHAPAIDGDLSDWPPGLGNVAGGFQLITGPGGSRGDDDDLAPARGTFALVLRDRTAVYVAINCESPGLDPMTLSRRNTVTYEDLVPVGEELVEVLFDPLNAGTRSPSDLYRVVVKPSGAYLLEKGIRTDPPCAVAEVWPAEVTVATAIRGDRWTAELRIPLSAFADAPTAETVWGFNLVRFDVTGQEMSTWSGAAGNAYDPLGLGNLYLP